jgi:hypothetical protein
MDINYFLFLKGKYNSMLSNINNIIEMCKDIDEYSEELSNYDNELHIIFNSDTNRKIFVERKRKVQYSINLCNQYIHSLCKHDIIKDEIDIDPDKSMTISYCRLCELSEEEYSAFK